MNIIIYPNPNKNLNVNEKNFINVPIFLPNYKLVKDEDIDSLENYTKKIINNINSITILLDNYGVFISKNIDFIINNKNIKFFIHENDIHFLRSKANTFKRYNCLRSKLKNNKHIFILAHYWYHYKKLYEIDSYRIICFPKFIFYKNIFEINDVPVRKILLSGSTSKFYPMRKLLKSLNHPKVEILTHDDKIFGSDYIKYLKNFLCCFTCCLNKYTPYLINKFFEIPSSGSLLLAYDEYIKEELKSIGFKDGENYISCNKKNLIEKIKWICDIKNKEKIDIIRKNGYNLVINNHTEKNRYELLKKLIENKS